MVHSYFRTLGHSPINNPPAMSNPSTTRKRSPDMPVMHVQRKRKPPADADAVAQIETTLPACAHRRCMALHSKCDDKVARALWGLINVVVHPNNGARMVKSLCYCCHLLDDVVGHSVLPEGTTGSLPRDLRVLTAAHQVLHAFLRLAPSVQPRVQARLAHTLSGKARVLRMAVSELQLRPTRVRRAELVEFVIAVISLLLSFAHQPHITRVVCVEGAGDVPVLTTTVLCALRDAGMPTVHGQCRVMTMLRYAHVCLTEMPQARDAVLAHALFTEIIISLIQTSAPVAPHVRVAACTLLGAVVKGSELLAQQCHTQGATAALVDATASCQLLLRGGGSPVADGRSPRLALTDSLAAASLVGDAAMGVLNHLCSASGVVRHAAVSGYRGTLLASIAGLLCDACACDMLRTRAMVLATTLLNEREGRSKTSTSALVLSQLGVAPVVQAVAASIVKWHATPMASSTSLGWALQLLGNLVAVPSVTPVAASISELHAVLADVLCRDEGQEHLRRLAELVLIAGLEADSADRAYRNAVVRAGVMKALSNLLVVVESCSRDERGRCLRILQHLVRANPCDATAAFGVSAASSLAGDLVSRMLPPEASSRGCGAVAAMTKSLSVHSFAVEAQTVSVLLELGMTIDALPMAQPLWPRLLGVPCFSEALCTLATVRMAGDLQLSRLASALLYRVDPTARQRRAVHLRSCYQAVSLLAPVEMHGRTADRQCVICMSNEPLPSRTNVVSQEDTQLHGHGVYLPCMHYFHAQCVVDWFSRAGTGDDVSTATCPVCRRPSVSDVGALLLSRL